MRVYAGGVRERERGREGKARTGWGLRRGPAEVKKIQEKKRGEEDNTHPEPVRGAYPGG